jgi:mRNA interferase YafQ
LSAPARFTATLSERNADSTGAIDSLISGVVSLLSRDQVLPVKNRDHGLSGEWDDHRECHLKPDLLLIYRKPDTEILQLVRMGSHSELFG